ncbi:CHAP domain-containing protein [Kordia zhangzhouensis]|uniref:CHAP domain-containing protein n=1 Tax=Kordia zhangzhouensis TaxID=1620405 RepID=UPI0006294871|nr:CHAP domain-containing protein [Kordia zhangzhouensis]
MKRLSVFILSLGILIGLLIASKYINFNPFRTVGEPIDTFHNVTVYYNGAVNHVTKRNTAKDGYNLGLQYQCVEFVKRYYYEYFNHKMPDSYGHAKDFFDSNVKDGSRNLQRNLIQYTNGSSSKPKVHDIIVFRASWYNSFGHVAIVCNVSENQLTIIQQNAGPFSSTRVTYDLEEEHNHWKVKDNYIIGWLRKE